MKNKNRYILVILVVIVSFVCFAIGHENSISYDELSVEESYNLLGGSDNKLDCINGAQCSSKGIKPCPSSNASCSATKKEECPTSEQTRDGGGGSVRDCEKMENPIPTSRCYPNNSVSTPCQVYKYSCKWSVMYDKAGACLVDGGNSPSKSKTTKDCTNG